MRLATPLAILALAAAPLAGCGGSSPEKSSSSPTTQPRAGTPTAPAGASARSCRTRDSGAESLRATGTTCPEARHLLLGWRRNAACAPPAGPSRSGCSVRSYRCLATATDRGWSVSCAKPGRSVAFISRD
jgi:hypothetical protein